MLAPVSGKAIEHTTNTSRRGTTYWLRRCRWSSCLQPLGANRL